MSTIHSSLLRNFVFVLHFCENPFDPNRTFFAQVHHLLLSRFDRSGAHAVAFDDFICCCLVLHVGSNLKNSASFPATKAQES